LRAVLIASIVCIVFAVAGEAILRLFTVSIPALPPGACGLDGPGNDLVDGLSNLDVVVDSAHELVTESNGEEPCQCFVALDSLVNSGPNRVSTPCACDDSHSPGKSSAREKDGPRRAGHSWSAKPGTCGRGALASTVQALAWDQIIALYEAK